jgi:hypothetical protein
VIEAAFITLNVSGRLATTGARLARSVRHTNAMKIIPGAFRIALSRDIISVLREAGEKYLRRPR